MHTTYIHMEMGAVSTTLGVGNLRWMGCRMIKGAEKKALVELPQQERFRGGWDRRGSGNQNVKRNLSEKQLLTVSVKGWERGTHK